MLTKVPGVTFYIHPVHVWTPVNSLIEFQQYRALYESDIRRRPRPAYLRVTDVMKRNVIVLYDSLFFFIRFLCHECIFIKLSSASELPSRHVAAV